jgi:signal transduction histidine kinase
MDDSVGNSALGWPDRRWTWLDPVDRLVGHLADVDDPERNPRARRLMADVMLDRAESFLVLLRVSGVVLDAGRHALGACGLRREQVVGLPLWETPWWAGSRAAQEATRRAVRAVAHDGRRARFDVDLWLEAAGRRRGTLDLTIRPLRDRDGAVELLLADGRSVTDRRRAERRRAQQTSNVVHDLKMPLQTLLARTEALLDGEHPEELAREARGIRASALGALTQVESALEQLRRGGEPPRLRPTKGDLASTIGEVLAEFAPVAAMKGIKLVAPGPRALEASYDAERVSRIVANLVANALRFTPGGGIVRCSLRGYGSRAHIEVADSGPGVPPETRRRLFDRFETGGSDRSGTGLGLSIVKELVDLHGGRIRVDRAVEGGARFVVTLPVDAPGPASRPSLSQRAAVARQIALVRSALDADLEATAS